MNTKQWMIATALICLTAGTSYGQYWIGPNGDSANPGSGSWSIGTNWLGGSAPSGTDAYFYGTSAYTTNQDADLQATPPRTITISTAPSGSATDIGVISGNAITTAHDYSSPSGSHSQSTTISKSGAGNFRIDSDIVAHEDNYSFSSGTYYPANMTIQHSRGGTLTLGNVDGTTVSRAEGANLHLNNSAYSGEIVRTVVNGSLQTRGSGRLLPRSHASGPSASSTIELNGPILPNTGSASGGMSIAGYAGAGGFSRVAINNDVTANPFRSLSFLAYTRDIGSTSRISLDSNASVNMNSGYLILNAYMYDYDPTTTAEIQLNGQITGDIGSGGTGVITANSGSPTLLPGRTEFNNATNGVRAGLLDIYYNAAVHLDDAYGGPSSNNLPNVAAFRVQDGSLLDTSGLAGGGLELGRDQVQSLQVDAGGTYNGGLTVRSRSTANFDDNFVLDSGESLFNNGSFTAPGITMNGGMIGGTGTFNLAAPVVLGAGVVLAPGSSVDTTNLGVDQTWNDGLTLQFEISDATQIPANIGANPGWDLWDISGNNLDISALTAGGVTLDLTTVLSGDGTTAGLMDNFDPTQNYAWEFVRYGTLTDAVDFNTGLFNIVTGNFTNPFTGTFSVTNVGNAFQIAYSGVGGGAVPEPGTWALFALLIAAGVMSARRRRSSMAQA